MIRSWMKMLLAILLGNVIYFALVPYLPRILVHDVFRLDAGLFADLAICIGVYAGILRIVRN